MENLRKNRASVLGGKEEVSATRIMELRPHGNRVNPKSILVQTTQEHQAFVLPRFRHVHVDEQLVDGAAAVVVGGGQSHDVDADLFVAVVALQDGAVGIERALHDGERRRRSHFLRWNESKNL